MNINVQIFQTVARLMVSQCGLNSNDNKIVMPSEMIMIQGVMFSHDAEPGASHDLVET